MADWGPVIVAVVLFVLLTPGLLFQMPGGNRVVEFGNMQTSGASIVVHAVIFFGLITIFLIAIGVCRASVIVGMALRVFVFNNLVVNLWDLSSDIDYPYRIHFTFL
ncbi:hypothetical protein OIU85_009724 [Salix viminalis]|uniref:Uncharacterized protein n=1 Tax=Salix viminalis TaxID=40686 RepID=A0A9Q0SGR5_SALVM|nr:hypothetical protein OIU76_022378 [Salix suchowensis]KAJ6676470.1 hypothetical protein OIU85_009724 [Salix viminalis]